MVVVVVTVVESSLSRRKPLSRPQKFDLHSSQLFRKEHKSMTTNRGEERARKQKKEKREHHYFQKKKKEDDVERYVGIFCYHAYMWISLRNESEKQVY